MRRSMTTMAGMVSAAVVSCGRVDFRQTNDASHDAASDAARDAAVDAAPATGCADGVRDEFRDTLTIPRLAGCAGGWSVLGVLADRTGCLVTGNNSSNPSGQGCAAADLCSPGWHICSDQNDVAARVSAPDGCTALLRTGDAFYVTRQGSSGNGQCNGGGTDDLFGCGMASVTGGACLPLNASSNDRCTTMPPGWSCPTTNSRDELSTVVHDGTHGGVLCCAP